MKIAMGRAAEIGLVVANAIAAGYDVAFITLTMKHHLGQALKDLWGALSLAWGAVTSGRGWVADQVEHDLQGWLRAVEGTVGGNGWHMHIHALVIGKFDVAGLETLRLSMWERWSSALQRAGLDAPQLVGSDCQLVTDGDISATALGRYLAKGVGGAASIGRELTMTQGKTARSNHATRSLWEVLDEFCANGELGSRMLWHEWEQVSKGKRQLTWSKGLRERFAVPPEQTDEEIAAAELGTVDDTLVYITRRGWRTVVKTTDLQWLILETAEAEGRAGVCRLLQRCGVEYMLPLQRLLSRVDRS